MKPIAAALLFPWLILPLCAQGNYEVQVYPGDTQEPGTTMV